MEIIIPFAINVLTQVVKNNIKPKFGRTGVHVFIFMLAMFVSLGQMLYTNNDNFALFVRHAVMILGASITMYELVLKRVMPK